MRANKERGSKRHKMYVLLNSKYLLEKGDSTGVVVRWKRKQCRWFIRVIPFGNPIISVSLPHDDEYRLNDDLLSDLGDCWCWDFWFLGDVENRNSARMGRNYGSWHLMIPGFIPGLTSWESFRVSFRTSIYKNEIIEIIQNEMLMQVWRIVFR